jgi:subtilisin family serine protease
MQGGEILRKALSRIIIVSLILTWALSENVYTEIVENAMYSGGIRVSKAMSKRNLRPKAQDTYTSTSEPYFPKQWALHNDGSFTLANSNYLNMIQSAKEKDKAKKPSDHTDVSHGNTDTDHNNTNKSPNNSNKNPNNVNKNPNGTNQNPNNTNTNPNNTNRNPNNTNTNPNNTNQSPNNSNTNPNYTNPNYNYTNPNYNNPDTNYNDSDTISNDLFNIIDDLFTVPEDDDSDGYDMYPEANENAWPDRWGDDYSYYKESIATNPSNHGCKKKDNNNILFQQLSHTVAVPNIDIDAKEAWDVVKNQGREVIVAEIDTGFDYNHEDLKNVSWINKKEIPGDHIDNDHNGYVDDAYGWNFCANKPFSITSPSSEYDHGTHIAGVIAARMNNIGIAGIVPNNNVKIMNIKALGGSSGCGTPDEIIQGIKYAEKMGASICNISFGTTDNVPRLKEAISNSHMLFVCAAGNDNGFDSKNADVHPTYPAAYNLNNIISVANLNFDGSLDNSSYYGQNSVDIAAPGTAIFSTLSGNKYGYMSGTSMAAPMVTGVAAMVYSYYDTISLSDTKKIVLDSVKQLPALKGKVATGGMLNAYNAVTYKLSK